MLVTLAWPRHVRGPLDDFAFYQARFGHEGHEENHEWIKGVWVILQQYSRDGSPSRALVSGKGRYCGDHSWDWLLEDPSKSKETEGYLRDVLSRADFTLPNPSQDLASKIVCDPFTRLPLGIIHMVASSLDLTDLLSLSSASWIVNIQLRDDRMFRVTIMKYKLMPFYFELGELDRKEEGLLHRHNPKDLCVWIHWSTSPELGDLSAVPGVVNRRRIWKTCLQFGELHQIYTSTLPSQATSDVSPFTEFSSNSLVFGHTYWTAWPYPGPSASDRRPERYQPLLHSWEALASSKHQVSVAWHPDKSLDTICVTPYLESIHGEEPQGEEIPRGYWIRQLILHIPGFHARRHRACSYTILPRGLTVVLSSGKELRFGETDDGHYMRPLIPSRNGAKIVGLSCKYGLVYGHDRAVYYSVVDALPPTDNHDNQEQQESQLFDWGLEPERLAQYLWKYDYRDVLGGVRIWEFPGLHLVLPVRNVFTWYSTRDNPLPLAMESLVWATKAADFGRLTRLSVCIVKEDVSICALKVESGPAVGTRGAPLC
ncbi:hypothetical protein PG996_007492 [Apiospora saccharicola]|uniref:F-box domain-containing protein n=1 Tax=Apiospora saccharicola TaxID=335842 RepID=A0ABR1VAZ0_9PEZI